MTPRYDLLRRGLWIMKGLPDEKVNLMGWGHIDKGRGTVACLAGHLGCDAVFQSETGVSYDARLGVWGGGKNDETTFETMARAVAISSGQSIALFDCDLHEGEGGKSHRAIAIARLTKFLSDAGELDGPIPGVTDTTAAVDAIKASMERAVETRQLVEGDDPCAAR